MGDKNLKSYYDPLFDEIFYSKEFIDYVIKNKGYCPNGLTFDTRFDDTDMYFKCCCKEYGYDYNPHDRIIGDYTIINNEIDLEDYAILCYKYLNKVNSELANEIEKYDICY